MQKKLILPLILSTTLLVPTVDMVKPNFLIAEQSTENIDCVEILSYRNKLDEQREVVKETLAKIIEENEEIEVINEIFEEEVVEVEETYEESVNENIIYCKFEVSFYTTAADEGSGTGIGASGEYVQPWVSIALPKDIPFYSTAYIEGLGNFVNHDTGSYIQWAYDEYGNLVCRVDVCVSTKEEAFSLGRYYSDGYIIINE